MASRPVQRESNDLTTRGKLILDGVLARLLVAIHQCGDIGGIGGLAEQMSSLLLAQSSWKVLVQLSVKMSNCRRKTKSMINCSRPLPTMASFARFHSSFTPIHFPRYGEYHADFP